MTDPAPPAARREEGPVDAASPLDVEAAAAPRRTAPLRPVVAQGVAFVCLLAFFWYEVIDTQGLRLAAGEWLLLLLPEIGFVVLFEAAWLLLGAFAGGARGRRLWSAAFHGSHLALYLLVFLAHVFQLHTGTRLRLNLMTYGVANFRMLQELVAFFVDSRFYIRLALVALVWMLAGRLGAKAQRPRRLAPLAVGACVVFGALALRAPDLAGGRLSGFAAATVPRLLRPASTPPPGPTLELYEPPRVTAVDPPRGRRPNILLVILESTRRDAVAPYAETAATPALASLAARGQVYDEVYAGVSHTSKALVGLLCGFFPRLSMPIVESLEDGLPLTCAPRLLDAAGYRTAFMQTALARFENRPGLVRNLGFGSAAFQETLRSQGFAETGYLGMDEFAMLRPALEWVREGPEPYFLTLLTVSTHHPYQTPGLPEPARGEESDAYRLALAHQDRFLGAVLTELSRSPGLDDTVVIVVGDHGEAFGEHLRMQHDAVPYQEVMAVPLVIAGPEWLGPPRRVGGLRHHHDLLPTLLELAGVRWEGTLPGRSLLDEGGHERVFSSCWYDDYCLAMREGNLKFVYHFDQQPTQVFDLARDPGELDDLADEIPAERLREAEARIFTLDRSVAAYYAPRPPKSGRRGWWMAR